ncbi:MAG: Polysaccharide deacetylase [Syntrophus sp. PtaB.Bin138]|nr:MAG: Polysaccharide deacetylase [Syntrophus sp. PtaB.Bin138]
MKRLIALVISALFYTAYLFIRNIFQLLNKRIPTQVICLTYHSITEERRSQFIKQMAELTKVGTPVSGDIKKPSADGLHYIIVTFDDGFENIIKNALPAMHETNIPATIFVTTGYMGRKPGWITDPKHPSACEFLMTEEQLKNLNFDQVTIGSHTVSHPHLSDLDTSALKKELSDSKSKLEELLQRKVTLIALPYGSIDMENTQHFKEAGYERVFLNIPTFPATLNDRYFVGRIDTSPDDWMVEYKLKLRGAYQWLPWAIAAKRSIKTCFQGLLHNRGVSS